MHVCLLSKYMQCVVNRAASRQMAERWRDAVQWSLPEFATHVSNGQLQILFKTFSFRLIIKEILPKIIGKYY